MKRQVEYVQVTGDEDDISERLQDAWNSRGEDWELITATPHVRTVTDSEPPRLVGFFMFFEATGPMVEEWTN